MSEPHLSNNGEPEKEPLIHNGRYEGGDVDIHVVLRVDTEETGVISGDVYRKSPADQAYVASVRTAPGLRALPSGGHWAAAWQDSLGAATTGSIAVAAAADNPDAVRATLRLDQRLNGLPPGRDLEVVAQLTSSGLRELGIELEKEDGVRLPAPVPFHGRAVTLPECLRAAGFSVREAGQSTAIPRRADGWAISESLTVLHDLMAASAQTAVNVPSWDLHLLMLSKSTRPGLLGVMFDASGVLPRQGCAVFADEIRERLPDDVEERKLLQTTVHELGHALNLAHRFERGVGRADSTSFMNYDWRYQGGRRDAEFWEKFAFTFDDDELAFLRHAPRDALIPGGAAFHSITYWADGTGGYSPYLPEVPVPGFELTLTPPAAGPAFAFGQPVFLEITLKNKTAQGVPFPPEILDPKTGFLEILIRRRTGAPTLTLADAEPFVPIMQRCFDVSPADAEVLPPGGAVRNNLNLTFGAAGFPFAEPGGYDVIPLLSFPNEALFGQTIDQVIVGTPLRVWIGQPHDPNEERDAMTLFRPDVGAWFALGGGDFLDQAGPALEEVRERRASMVSGADPLVATIVRAAGIDAGRPSIRYREGQWVERPGDQDRAARLLGSLDAAALRAFDPHTAENTAALARSYGA